MRSYEISPGILQRLAWTPLRTVLYAFGSLEIRGMEHVQRIEGNMIFASNHASELDPFLLVACMPFFSRHLPLFFTSRERDFYGKSGWKRFLYGGTFFRMMGGYKTYVGLKDYGRALQHHLHIARNGNNVCIFPHGTRARPGQILKARGGVSFLALETRRPIVPVRIAGLEDITLYNFFLRKGKITVIFGEPIHPRDLFENAAEVTVNETRNDYSAAAEKIMQRVAQLA